MATIKRYDGSDFVPVGVVDNNLSDYVTETAANGAYRKLDGVFQASSYDTIQEAVDAAESAGAGRVAVSDGTYTENVTISSDGIALTLAAGAFIDGTLTLDGQFLEAATETAATAGVYAAGATSLNGDFSHLSNGDLIAIQPTATSDASNQIGVDFVTVQTASASTVTFSPASRYQHTDPIVYEASWESIAGTLTEGDQTLTLSSLSVTAGDILRIENIDGTDTPTGDSDYFELVRVRSVSGSTVTLEDQFAHTHTNPKVAKLAALSDVTVEGGRIETVTIRACEGLTVKNIKARRMSSIYVYSATYNDIEVDSETAEGIGWNATFSRHLTVSDIRTYGTTISSDNAAFKMLGCVDSTINGVGAWDTNLNSYPVFIDYYFTPYRNWTARCTFSDITATHPRTGQTRSIWLIGLRDCIGSTLTATGGVRLELLDGGVFQGIHADVVVVKDVVGAGPVVSAIEGARYMSVEGCPNTIFGPGVFGEPGGDNSDRVVWVRAGTEVGNCNGAMFRGIKGLATGAGVRTFYIQASTDVMIDGCSDKAGLLGSVAFGSGTTAVLLGSNDLRNSVPTGAKSKLGLGNAVGVSTSKTGSGPAIQFHGEGSEVTQGGAVASVPTAGSATASANATAINSILDRLRRTGYIAT